MSDKGRVVSKVTITNVSEGPRGFNAVAGPMLLEVGQTAEGVEMTAAEKASSEKTGWFKFGAEAAKQAKAEQAAQANASGDATKASKAAALLAQAPDMEFNNLRSEARQVTGDNTLNSKVEIMEALQKAAAEG